MLAFQLAAVNGISPYFAAGFTVQLQLAHPVISRARKRDLAKVALKKAGAVQRVSIAPAFNITQWYNQIG